MTGQNVPHRLGRLRDDGAWLRARLASVAANIAYTEDQVAKTMEGMALAMPEDAVRLRARAEQARRFAAVERDRAARFGGH